MTTSSVHRIFVLLACTLAIGCAPSGDRASEQGIAESDAVVRNIDTVVADQTGTATDAGCKDCPSDSSVGERSGVLFEETFERTSFSETFPYKGIGCEGTGCLPNCRPDGRSGVLAHTAPLGRRQGICKDMPVRYTDDYESCLAQDMNQPPPRCSSISPEWARSGTHSWKIVHDFASCCSATGGDRCEYQVSCWNPAASRGANYGQLKLGSEYWIAFSIYVPSAENPAPFNPFGTIWQSQRGGTKTCRGESHIFSVLFRSGPKLVLKMSSRVETLVGNLTPDTVYDFVANVKFATAGEGGKVHVWINDEQVIDRPSYDVIRPEQVDCGKPQLQPKAGIYTSYWDADTCDTSKVRARNCLAPDPAKVVFFRDDLRIGDHTATYQDMAPGNSP